MSLNYATGEISLEPLTDAEATECEQLETAIGNGLRSFRVVGEALMRIRDGRLYRDRFGSFETYCETTWGLSRRHADRLAMAAQVADVLEVDEVGPIGLTSESQARELAPLLDRPDEMRAAYEEALAESSGEPTAKQLGQAVKKRTTTTTTVVVEEFEEPAKPKAEKDPEPPQDPAAKRAADRAYDIARSLTAYPYRVVDEKTVRLLEAYCERWREQA